MESILKDALLLGQNKNIAEEEYLVATHEKEPALVEVTEKSLEYENITIDTYKSIKIDLVQPGYIEFEVSCQDSFIQIDKHLFSTEDFVNGSFSLQFKIIESKLHAGKNFTFIKIYSSTQEIEIPVEVNIQVKVLYAQTNAKSLFIKLEKIYLEYRLANISMNDWIEQSIESLDSVGGLELDSMFLMLYKAQLCIHSQNYQEAANILMYLAEQIPRLPGQNMDLICYFNYVRLIYEDIDEEKEALLENIKGIYETNKSWRILWIMLQLDKKYNKNPENLIEDIENEFYNGCHSPIMYVEALRVLRTHPEYVFELNDFELQVLNYGVKNNFLNASLAERLSEIVLSLPRQDLEKRDLKIIAKILKSGFEQYQTRNLIKALCLTLIALEDKSPSNGKYFDAAISEFLDDIPELFTYYIFTLNQDVYNPIPKRLMEYFTENIQSIEGHQSYFFANIIVNKDTNPEYYRAFQKAMILYAQESIVNGIVDKHMSIIFKDILENNLLTQQLQSRLFEVLATKKIICHSKIMKSVIAFHNELNTFQEVFLQDGEAFIRIYSSDAVILFKDAKGNLYANVEYEKCDLLNSKSYIDLCIKGVPISEYMIMKDTFALLKAYKTPVEILEFLTKKIDYSRFRASYISELINNNIEYYYRNTNDTLLHDELLEFLKYEIPQETRGKLIDILIERTLYKRAYAEIQRNGFECIDEENLMKLSIALIELGNYKYNDMLVRMCEHCFSSTNFNPKLYRYLAENYNDKLDLMVDLYRTGNAFSVPTGDLPERILRKTIEIEVETDLNPAIFAKYFMEGEDEELKKKYLIFKCKKYLYGQEKKDASFFKFVEDMLNSKTEFPTIVYVAYLLFMSDKNLESEKRIRRIEEILKDLVSKSIMFNEFKAYGFYFQLPAMLANSVIISSNQPDSKVIYRIEGRSPYGNDPTFEEPLSEILEGYYTKYFTLFYGERLIYNLDNGPTQVINYADLDIVEDFSRYSELNRILKYNMSGQYEELRVAARDYYVKSKLIDKLF